MEQFKFQIKAKAFKKMESPVDSITRTKYVCYAQCASLPQGMEDWMSVNPRERKMTTDVARKIKDSLAVNDNFHELNRGILLSAENITFDNKTDTAEIAFTDFEKHGNIDGGHTLCSILRDKDISPDRYVFMEIIIGLDSPVELAEARNTSVQVDLKSIEELKGTFDVLKTILEKKVDFSDRIQYKMHDSEKDIDVREVVAMLLMFSQEIYNKKTHEHPLQCYSGKEVSLRKFVSLGEKKREKMLDDMQYIIADIFDIWEKIETSFAFVGREAGIRYGARKYSKYEVDDKGAPKIVGKSLFKMSPLRYVIPKGIMYPLVAAFRSLVEIKEDGTYYWKEQPLKVWEDIGSNLVTAVLEEKPENPDNLAKKANLWGLLYNQVLIHAYKIG